MKGNPGKANNIMGQTCDQKPGEEYARILLSGTSATLKVQTCFDDMRDEATFYYLDDTEWKKIGGKAGFRHFVYNQSEPKYIVH